MTWVLGSKWLNYFSRCTEQKIESFWLKKFGQILVLPVTQLLGSKWLNFFSRCTERKIESFNWPVKFGWILIPPVTQLFKSKLSHFDLKSWVTLVETKTFKLKKTFIVLVTQSVTGNLVLLLKLLISKIHPNYCDINYILNWFWKWFSNHLIFNVILILIFKSPLPKWFWFKITFV